MKEFAATVGWEVPDFPQESGDVLLGVFSSKEDAKNDILKDFVRLMKLNEDKDKWECSFNDDSILANDGVCYYCWDCIESETNDLEQ